MSVVSDFEGRKVEGNRKNRRRERVPQVGSRREETITELINSCIGEFQLVLGQVNLVFYFMVGRLGSG